MKTYIVTNEHPFLKQGVEIVNNSYPDQWVINDGEDDTAYCILGLSYWPHSNPTWYKEERWRAEKGNNFYSVCNFGNVDIEVEEASYYEDELWEAGNYYRTEEEAEAAAVRVKKAYKE